LRRLGPSLVSEVEGRDHRVRHEGAIANLGELDPPGAVGESPSKVGCDSKGEPTLPGSPRPNEADEAGGRELLPELAKLPSAADEACEFGREIARRAASSGHREYELTGGLRAPAPSQIGRAHV